MPCDCLVPLLENDSVVELPIIRSWEMWKLEKRGASVVRSFSFPRNVLKKQ